MKRMEIATSSAYFHDMCSLHSHIDECIERDDWRNLEEMYRIGYIACDLKNKLKATLTRLYDFYLEKDPMHAKNSSSNKNHNKRKVNENLSIQETPMLKYKAHLEDEKQKN
uniref:Uncharacterized protein n=1 Tax=Lactuca sativa TaxID=4236 RepID=A0A9R1WQE2_LACSA|nr:hypothetical protein LSAT_V11C900487690 [Lactuca sativa]